MKKKFIVIIMLFMCIFFAGCAANNAFLLTNQKQLGFKPEEGGVLLSFVLTANYIMAPNAIYVQEINQYKHFNKRKIQTLSVPKPDANNGLYFLNAKLPRGRYLLTSIGGSSQTYASCWKMFVVKSGEILYIGRIDAKPGSSEIKDYYKEDVQFFTNKYPLLQSEKIKKGLLY